MLVGIDFGSKLAGTTSICYEMASKLDFLSSKKGQDADNMILEFCKQHQPKTLFLDAPLSLPAVYSEQPPVSSDYFYRACDKQLSAMSPMFLGGLTARAMKLAANLSKQGTQVLETYPKWQALRLDLPAIGYKKDTQSLQACAEVIEAENGFKLNRLPASWHELDALLALVAASRFEKKVHNEVGESSEGLIYL